MDRPSGKRSKKSLKPFQHIFLGIPTNVAAGPLGFRAELDIGPKGEKSRPHHDSETDRPDPTGTPDEKDTRASRIVFCDKEREDQGAPVEETSTCNMVIGDDEQGNGLPSECHRFPLSWPMLIRISVPPLSAEASPGDTREEGRPAVASAGTRMRKWVVRFLLTPTSFGEGLRGHFAFGNHRSH